MAAGDIEGLNRAIKKLNAAYANLQIATYRGLYRGAVLILKTAQKGCPIVTGNLRASGYVVTLGVAGGGVGKAPQFRGDDKADMTSNHGNVVGASRSALDKTAGPQVIIGFSAMYALMVHENPNAGKGHRDPKVPIYKRRSEVGGSKFLERAINQRKKQVLELIVAEGKRSLR